jgi:hypothetical protein
MAVNMKAGGITLGLAFHAKLGLLNIHTHTYIPSSLRTTVVTQMEQMDPGATLWTPSIAGNSVESLNVVKNFKRHLIDS